MKMEESDPRLQYPLSETTRRERRSLLGFSVLGLLISWSGAVPESIPALGITTEDFDPAVLLWVLIMMLFYYMFAFVLYALSDYLNWLESMALQTGHGLENARKEEIERLKTTAKQVDLSKVALPNKQDYESLEDIHTQITNNIKYRQDLNEWIKPIPKTRIIFELVFPFLFGIYVILDLLRLVLFTY
jgi:uncharacterized membrane protein (DUF106 family)